MYSKYILIFACSSIIAACVFLYLKSIKITHRKRRDKIHQDVFTPSKSKRHPVLEYKMAQDFINGGSTPATAGDILAPPDIAGPYSDNAIFSKLVRPDQPVPGYGESSFGRYGSFGQDQNFPGPSVYDERGIGVTIPAGALKFYNERYNKDQFYMDRYSSSARDIKREDVSNIFPGIPYQGQNSSSNFYRPYGPNSYINTMPFYGSVNSYSPFPEILSPWEKAGILTSSNRDEKKNPEILNLYRRAIAPLQDLWEYQVQDKDDFVIKLYNRYIEDGDIVDHIIGKPGRWIAHIFVQDKYIRV